MVKASITYDITTPESAEEGCTAEHGWWMPGGWEHALEDDDGYHDDVLEAAQKGDFDLEIGEAIRAAIDHGCIEVQNNGKSLSAYSLGENQDMHTGGYTRHCLHIDGCSEGSIKRIERLLK